MRDKIDKVNDLNKYALIHPKSIQINTYGVKFSFIKELIEIFDTSITSFNEINCLYSPIYCHRILSNVARKINFSFL
jgi:hypothetical protein